MTHFKSLALEIAEDYDIEDDMLVSCLSCMSEEDIAAMLAINYLPYLKTRQQLEHQDVPYS